MEKDRLFERVKERERERGKREREIKIVSEKETERLEKRSSVLVSASIHT
jgi:hypothetical protein